MQTDRRTDPAILIVDPLRGGGVENAPEMRLPVELSFYIVPINTDSDD